MKTKEEYQKEISILEDRINELNNRMIKLEEEIDELNSEKYDLECELDELEAADEMSFIRQEMIDMKDYECKHAFLHSSTKTTPIIDDFYNSPAKYLIFRNMFLVYPNKYTVSLVVTKSRGNIRSDYSRLTMTNLKQLSGDHINRDSLKWIDEEDRKYYLYRELVEVGEKEGLKAGDRVPFNTPCRLSGQTFDDQTGFGWDTGKEYGEATRFYIIGVIINNIFPW